MAAKIDNVEEIAEQIQYSLKMMKKFQNGGKIKSI